MEEKIQQALVQIESDLQSIKSAREQVENVVSAASDLQNKVGTFVDEVSGLSQQVEGLMHSIANGGSENLENFKTALETMKSSCSGFMEQMNSGSSKFVTEFQQKTTELSNAIKQQVECLQAEVCKLDSAKSELVLSLDVVRTANTNIEDLAKELKTSQKAQDEELKNIRDNSHAITNKADAIFATVNKIDEALSTQEKSITQLVQSLNAANAALSGISSLIPTAQSSLSSQIQTLQTSLSNQIQNDVKELLQALNATLENVKQTLEKKVGKLQTIVIIQLFLTIALICLWFIK
ncbi:MAG: hypothetical protein K6E73_08065 [Bacteroidales bacterium]|nr:hypothetical protein [Bacteroidales bacterium]